MATVPPPPPPPKKTGTDKEPEKLYPVLSDDSSSEEEVPASLKTTAEERAGTIPGSAHATAAALAGSRAQSNPVVPRRKFIKVKKTEKTPVATSKSSK